MFKFLTPFLVLAIALPARADAPLPMRPDDPALAAYVARAVRNGPDASARRILVQAAEAAAVAADRARRPSVTVDGRYTETFGNTLDLGELIEPVYATLNQVVGEPRFPTDVDLTLPLRLEARARLTQPIVAPAIGFGRDLAAAGVAARRAETALGDRELAAAARVAYLRHAQARALGELLARSRPLLEEALAVSRALEAAQVATGDAVPRAEAELAAFDQSARVVAAQAEAAARALNLLAGLPLDAAVPTPTLAAPAPATTSLAGVLAHARGARTELSALASGRAATLAEAALVRASRLPTLALALDLGVQSDGRSLGTVDAYVAISLVGTWAAYDGTRAPRARARELEASVATVRAAQLADQIEAAVRDAWAGADVARAAIASAEARVAAARAAHDVVARRYAAAAVPQLELIAARNALLTAETDLIVATVELHLRLVEVDRVAELASPKELP